MYISTTENDRYIEGSNAPRPNSDNFKIKYTITILLRFEYNWYALKLNINYIRNAVKYDIYRKRTIELQYKKCIK